MLLIFSPFFKMINQKRLFEQTKTIHPVNFSIVAAVAELIPAALKTFINLPNQLLIFAWHIPATPQINQAVLKCTLCAFWFRLWGSLRDTSPPNPLSKKEGAALGTIHQPLIFQINF